LASFKIWNLGNAAPDGHCGRFTSPPLGEWQFTPQSFVCSSSCFCLVLPSLYNPPSLHAYTYVYIHAHIHARIYMHKYTYTYMAGAHLHTGDEYEHAACETLDQLRLFMLSLPPYTRTKFSDLQACESNPIHVSTEICASTLDTSNARLQRTPPARKPSINNTTLAATSSAAATLSTRHSSTTRRVNIFPSSNAAVDTRDTSSHVGAHRTGSLGRQKQTNPHTPSHSLARSLVRSSLWRSDAAMEIHHGMRTEWPSASAADKWVRYIGPSSQNFMAERFTKKTASCGQIFICTYACIYIHEHI